MKLIREHANTDWTTKSTERALHFWWCEFATSFQLPASECICGLWTHEEFSHRFSFYRIAMFPFNYRGKLARNLKHIPEKKLRWWCIAMGRKWVWTVKGRKKQFISHQYFKHTKITKLLPAFINAIFDVFRFGRNLKFFTFSWTWIIDFNFIWKDFQASNIRSWKWESCVMIFSHNILTILFL